MAETLTDQQREAVFNRGGSLLVSAAAGSGKTKVLVDRLLSYIMDKDDPADIDQFLIITYTKAAAAELRGKIAAKIAEHMAQNPLNYHLHKQMNRIYLAKISTVHSFCSDILKEYAYQLDISADFRMAEENECQQLQSAILDKILDEAYENIENNPDLTAFVDTQGLGRDDKQVPEIIQKVYNRARCHLNPKAWLEKCVDISRLSSLDDAGKTPWGEYLIHDVKLVVSMHMDALKNCLSACQATPGMEKQADLMVADIANLQKILDCTTWDALHELQGFKWPDFPSKSSDPVLKAKVKAIRDYCKEKVSNKLEVFTNDTARTLADMESCCAASRGLIYLVDQFSEEYDKLKKSRRIMDFSDLEHNMLTLLKGKDRSAPTAVANEISKRFREIMVDEYQDSNAVQDAIFEALTCQRNNCFMVGDVKQSIYQFRLAEPQIFLDKYNHFAEAEHAKAGESRRVLLSDNFRSCGRVVDAVNDVFASCMSPLVGGLAYGPDEKLREGIPHDLISEPEIELHALQIQKDTYAEESAFVAQRIAQLLNEEHMIRTKEGLRQITCDDIVILLRSPGSVGMEFCQALQDIGISCTMGGGENLLDTEEISGLYALLQVISNPLQDIPLVAALSSRIFCFSADELAKIRGGKKYMPFFTSLKRSGSLKAKMFLEVLEDFRQHARFCSITQLIEYIFAKTAMDSVYASLPDGVKRTANLQEFCRIAAACEANGRTDIEQFIEHIDSLSRKGLVVTSDKKPSGSVTVMSIHKSKGLEFPVVFLCGLSKDINHRDAYEQVLCDKDLGLGLACVDRELRVRYPSAAKSAICTKMKAETVSEEMRVLYVALTRAKDRLIMTYASQHLDSALTNIALRMDMSSRALMTYGVGDAGRWILQVAMARTEAGALHAQGGKPDCSCVSKDPWLIQYYESVLLDSDEATIDDTVVTAIPEGDIERIRQFRDYQYGYPLATTAPSKLTATQLKGKGSVNGDPTVAKHSFPRLRKPSFVESTTTGTVFGNAVHLLMQHIDFSKVNSLENVQDEIQRITDCGYMSAELAAAIDPEKILTFFKTEPGDLLRRSKEILREFRFSILDAAERYIATLTNEQILLQGVIDCAVLEDDGITIIDFKTDKVNPSTISDVMDGYTPQVQAYMHALSRIYEKPIKAAYLYFFHMDQLVTIK